MVEKEKATPEMTYEMERAVEKEKKDTATYDIAQIRLNAENVLRVLQVQLTANLQHLSVVEQQIEQEVNAYWFKDLQIQPQIVQYIKTVGSLITLYTQIENILMKTFQEINEGVEFPQYDKIEQSYLDQIDELTANMKRMQAEVEKVKKDLEEEFDEAVKEESLKQKLDVHKHYESTMLEAEQRIKELENEINELRKNNPSVKKIDNSEVEPIKGAEIYNPPALEKPANTYVTTPDAKEQILKEIKDLSALGIHLWRDVRNKLILRHSEYAVRFNMNRLVGEGKLEKRGKGHTTEILVVE